MSCWAWGTALSWPLRVTPWALVAPPRWWQQTSMAMAFRMSPWLELLAYAFCWAKPAVPSRLAPVDLGGVERQAGQRHAAPCGFRIPSPTLLLQPPALLELPVGVILDVPAGPVRLQGCEAIAPSPRAHQSFGLGHRPGLRL